MRRSYPVVYSATHAFTKGHYWLVLFRRDIIILNERPSGTRNPTKKNYMESELVCYINERQPIEQKVIGAKEEDDGYSGRCIEYQCAISQGETLA
jgi:hypothetical protein